MASTIANYASAAGQPLAFTPGNRITLADQLTTPAAQTLVVAATFFRLLVSLKTYVVGSATVGLVIDFNVADNSGMSTNLTTLFTYTFKNVASATQTQICLQDVLCAAVASKGFWQLVMTYNGTSTGSVDIQVDAV